jgi:hypothetical protein
LRAIGHTAREIVECARQAPSLAEPGGESYIWAVQTLIHLLVLYLEYSLVTLALGAVVSLGLWFWLGLGSFSRSARHDL